MKLKRRIFFSVLILSMIVGTTSLTQNVLGPIYIPPSDPIIQVSGTVRDTLSGYAIAGVKVNLKQSVTNYQKTVYTDSKGYYKVKFTTPSSKPFTLTITKTGYVGITKYYSSAGIYIRNVFLKPTVLPSITFTNINNGDNVKAGSIVDIYVECSSFCRNVVITMPDGQYSLIMEEGDSPTEHYGTWYVPTITKDDWEIEAYYKDYYFNILKETSIKISIIRDDSTTLDFRNIGNDNKIMEQSSIDIIVRNENMVGKVTLESGNRIVEMVQWGTSNLYFATWDFPDYTLNSPNLYALNTCIKDFLGNSIIEKTITVEIIEDFLMNLYYEIDVVAGVDDPSIDQLNYVKNYWGSRGISVLFEIDDRNISCPANPWNDHIQSIEADFNDHQFADYGTVNDSRSISGAVTNSAEKWILWGDDSYTISRDVYVGGIVLAANVANPINDMKHIISGNYVYIGANSCPNPTYDYGYQVQVLMHEIGHTIGIGFKGLFTPTLGSPYYAEMYDDDKYSVMANGNPSYNYEFTNHWYYSYEYWDMIDYIY